jgi:hypothetical protein
MDELKCKQCEKTFPDYDGLRRHTARIHKVDSYQFYVNTKLNGVWPVCKCGCGEKVMWSRQLKQFRDYVAGHQSRIHNNWGNNPEALKKSLETRKKRFDAGELTTWNCGLTKDNDERVKNNGIKTSVGIISNPEELKRRSDLMSKNRKNGIIPTLFGDKHSRWNGGYSRVRDMIYADRRLYKEWKFVILGRDGFKCKQCGNTYKLHVHHDKETMSDIVHRFLSGTTDKMLEDFKIKRMITNAVVDYHIQNKVSGITLCDKCHEKYHPSLNFS